MQRFIRSFVNDNAIQEAVDNKSLGKPYVALDENTGLIDWNGKVIDYAGMYLTIEALEDGDFYMRNACSYSKNGGEWVSVTGETALALETGDKVRFKNNINADSPGMFTGNTMSFESYGNIESMEYGDEFIGKTTQKTRFSDYFKNSTGLVDVSNLILPATTLVTSAYTAMFSGCTSFETAPSLPSTTLADNCYHRMFEKCTKLTKAPDLPATALTFACYTTMFYGCTSLEKAPDLLANVVSNNGYNYMFNACSKLNYIKCLATNISASFATTRWVDGVSRHGTFVKSASMNNWSTGYNGIPRGWTVVEE